MSDASTTYSRRQFVHYQHLIDGGSNDEADATVTSYVRRFPDRDLDQPITFAQWLSEHPGGRPTERPSAQQPARA